jgi:hypothetical protein
MEEQENTNLHVIQLSGYQRPDIIESSREDWVTFGEDNSGFD